MSLFKHRPNKLKHLSNVKTLDEIHRTYMATFAKKRQSLPHKKNRLSELTEQLKSLEDNTKNFSTDDIKRRSSIKTEINSLVDEIKKIEDNSDIKDYYSKTGDILLSYYSITSGAFYGVECGEDTQNNVTGDHGTYGYSDNNTCDENNDVYSEIPISEEIDSSSAKISDALVNLNLLSQSKRKVKKPVRRRKIVYDNNANAKSILSFFAQDIAEHNVEEKQDISINMNRATLQDKYLMLVDRGYACDHIKGCQLTQCMNCGAERILNQSEGSYVCINCAESEHTLIESEIPSHKDAINEKPKYPYKKLNHLKEKLNQLQSKETADISDAIFETIKKELKKKRIQPKNSNPPLIRDILKKHKLVECYEHLQQIYCKISGAPPVTLSREIEERVINMFNVMQDSYQKHRPVNRSNFLNYSYVLNKIFRILGMEHHAEYFGLLKSKDKLREQDIIWGKICRDMGWLYHSSK